jgi:hypothetical protein
MTQLNSEITSALEAAREYLHVGWPPIPVVRGEKKATVPGWPELRLNESDLERTFNDGSSVGVLLGEPSGGLVDVDLDTPQARTLAAQFLPPTGCIFGRPSSRSSHYLYYVTPIPRPQQFRDPDGTLFVEIRSDRQMTVLPPSVHETGERRRWEKAGLPARVSAEELTRAVSMIAACSLLARHWPARGTRHQASLALAGMLLRHS